MGFDDISFDDDESFGNFAYQRGFMVMK